MCDKEAQQVIENGNASEQSVQTPHREQAAESVGRNSNTEFLQFRASFLEKIKPLRDKLLAVASSNSINVDELYQMKNDILKDMEYDMDAILYLNAVYSSSNYVVEHCLRVGLLANIFAKWLSLDENTMKDATVAGFIHDIGMLEIPPRILCKEEALTTEEYNMIKEHTARGFISIKNKGVKRELLDVVVGHHERYDGSGYPQHKKGNAIPFLTALISVVDVYDSMTSNRPYSPAVCPFDVINYFEKNMMDKFDPSLLYVFLENIPYMYKNSLVMLSDNNKARIIFINKNNKTAPIVQRVSDDAFIDLSRTPTVKIVSLL